MYVINLDEYSDIGTHWIALFVKNNDITYFNSFGVEHVPNEIIKFISCKNVIANILRIQAYDSIMCGYFCIGFINFMLKGKTLPEYTNLFSPNDFKKNDDIILHNSIEAIDKKKDLTEQTKFRLSEIIGIENYFYRDINERKSYIRKLNKYITIFEYIDKILIILSATSGGVSIISFISIAGVPVGIAIANFTLIFSIAKGIIKVLVKITRNKKKKHDNILMLAESKLNSIEMLISKALNEMEVSHKEFTIILNEKDRYEKIKYKLISENENNNIRLSHVKPFFKK